MPRFSIKDILLSTLLVAAWLAMKFTITSHEGPENLRLAIFVFGVGLIGAGLFAPFHRKALGATVAIALLFVLSVVAALIFGVQFDSGFE